MHRTNWLALAVAIGLGGCSGKIAERTPVELPPATPLSLEEWKALPDVEAKYDGATLDRLRMSDASLANDNKWDVYMKQVVIPERKKDLPDPGTRPE